MGQIHAATRMTPRLTRVLDVLRRNAAGATTHEIIHAGHVCAVNTCVSELRKLGHQIDCDLEAVTESGRTYRYRLVGAEQAEPPPVRCEDVGTQPLRDGDFVEVPSSSTSGKSYIVRNVGGLIACPCEGFFHRQRCQHAEKFHADGAE